MSSIDIAIKLTEVGKDMPAAAVGHYLAEALKALDGRIEQHEGTTLTLRTQDNHDGDPQVIGWVAL